MKRITTSYQGHCLDPLWVILDGQSSPPLLPLLYTSFLSKNGVVYEAREALDETSPRRMKFLIEKDVSDATIRSYVYCLAQFLSHLENCRIQYQTAGMHLSSACSQRFVNHYLNNVLPKRLDSFQSLRNHQSALVAYFNWLAYMEISPRLELKIHRKTRQLMADLSNKKHYIQYVSRSGRAKLLNCCESLAEKLVMRMGFEVGLRTSEMMGLRVFGEDGLLSLFENLESRDFTHVDQFRYRLKGRYTKGGKSRWIYFDRLLLRDMKRYFETERQWLVDQSNSTDASFFLRTDHGFKGTGIGREHASRVFRKRVPAAGLNPLLHFHDLRHTFATELFHAELAAPYGRETRSESAALIVVSQRLGHAMGKDGYASPVTTRYVRMRLQMLEIEGSENG
ncbi:MAG: site-specific integrase [Marinobacter sp.]|nr:site-specific integrase [Marinobacter sp.]